jgi:hypothetical protein
MYGLSSGSTNIGGAFAAAQIAGFNDQVVKFSGTTTLCYIPTRLRGVSIESIEIRDVNTGVSQNTWAITTALLKVVGLSRHIESVQNSTGKTLILTGRDWK